VAGRLGVEDLGVLIAALAGEVRSGAADAPWMVSAIAMLRQVAKERLHFAEGCGPHGPACWRVVFDCPPHERFRWRCESWRWAELALAIAGSQMRRRCPSRL
jgi:hypothetical protein